MPSPQVAAAPTSLAAERRRLRAARRALSPREQHWHAQSAARLLARLLGLRRRRHIALYLPNDGELDPGPLRARLGVGRVRWYLPVVRGHQQGRLWFVRWRDDAPMRPNRFGIPEPTDRRGIRPAWHLDLILVPLVAFDAAGRRLGMGGGFYDRSLAFLAGRRHWRRPRLVGLAHECQRVAQLASRPWDLPLDAVVTEARIYGDLHRSTRVGAAQDQ